MPYHQQHHRHHHEQKLEARDPEPQAVQTVNDVVYVTATPTFDGPVASYITPPADEPSPAPKNPVDQQVAHDNAGGAAPNFANGGSDAAPSAPPANSPAPPAPSSNQPIAGGAPRFTRSQNVPVAIAPAATTLSSQALPSQIVSDSSSAPPVVGTPIKAGSGSSSSSDSSQSSNAPIAGTPLRNPSTSTTGPIAGTPLSVGSSTSAPAAPDQSTPGISGAGKGGLAFGIIALVAILAGLGFVLYKRKKSQNSKHQKLDDEKSGFNEKSGFDQMQPGLVPRVSVRERNGQAPRLSMRPATNMFADAPAHNAQNEKSIGGMAATAASGSMARSPSPPPSRDGPPNGEPKNPFDDDAAPVEAPKPLNISRPSTPNGQTSPEAPKSPQPAVVAGGPGPLNVHRVQLDFSPSMDDELELHAGQLVRMLHEYDDGWVS